MDVEERTGRGLVDTTVGRRTRDEVLHPDAVAHQADEPGRSGSGRNLREPRGSRSSLIPRRSASPRWHAGVVPSLGMENRESLDGPLRRHSRREGARYSGAVAADAGVHCPTVRTTAQTSDKIISVIDSSPSKVSVRTHPRPQPAQHPRDGPQHPGRPQFALRFRCLHLRGDPVQDDLSSHNIPKTLTEAFAPKTVGAGRPPWRSVRSRGRDQDNPLLVRRQRPGTTRAPTRVMKFPS